MALKSNENLKNKNKVSSKINTRKVSGSKTNIHSTKHKNNNVNDSETKITNEKSTTKLSLSNPRINKTSSCWEILHNFMLKFVVKGKKGENLPHTHRLSDAPYGKFDIPEDMRAKFLKLYEDVIVSGYKPHVTEVHKEYGPIVIDFDFVCEKKGRFYTDATIRNCIKLYNTVIKKYLNVNNSEIIAYVSEKANPVLKKGKYHDGIHIMYPYICTKPMLQYIMREEFIELAKKSNIFKKIPLINDFESVFDKGVIYSVSWMLYGSSKDTESLPYYVTHIYHTTGDDSCGYKLIDYLIPGDNLKSRTNIRHFIDVNSCRRFFSVKNITPFAKGIDKLTIEAKATKIKNATIKNSNNKTKSLDLSSDKTSFIKTTTDENLAEAKKLVKFFSIERATDYHTWYQVGKCLHNLDYRLLEDWIEFSKKCKTKFKKGECESKWRDMLDSNYTMATLHYFAQKDDPKKYQQMKREAIDKLLSKGLEVSHNTTAKLLMEKYKFIYKCASIKHNIWYEFKNHRWVEIDSAYSLRNLISDKLTDEYVQKQIALYRRHAESEDDNEKKRCLDEAQHISKLIKNLNNSTFKNGVIRECADIAYDPNFLKNLDENNYLICFENGIYDLEARVFRDGCPDDCVSLCTNYKYIKYEKDDVIYKNINEFLEKIQPKKEMREYIMTLLSTCIAGSISEESFYVLTGTGANGKSKLMELLKNTLGDLYKPMDIRMLTEKRSSSSSASPELADKKGVRACPFDEPKATDEINTGFMKIFTGGDLITARALFKEPIYFKPQFKPFLLCNDLPNIKSDDDGTWRRLKVIPFLSKFIKPSEVTKKIKKNGLPENHYWADSDLSEKLPEWKQGFMCMLIKYYKKYKRDGLIHPKLVTQHTAEYRKRCDVFQDFITDYLQRTEDPKDSVSVRDLHENMRTWYRTNYDGKCPNAKELRNYIQHRMPTYVKKNDSLTCYKIKSSENEETLHNLLNVN
ncbi:D5-ATPase-helicase [Cotonvirus japonicus]|uniref:D5-ATPase-helicase n=1 Tax=Cotonvirus japonicus TaxID=2811091 RepID=A0ABM7NS26_9VIRU|nr:D5-ATPase-helicase [Cotonvirus japonicus]BCS82951.1 D5-ATPase-helicase [Cotonvirus japonicus]